MDSREIRKLLSACRPDRSDLTAEQLRAVDARLNQDVALREQWAAIQAWDAQLHTAFADVPIPAGLAERLQAAVSTPTAEDLGTQLPDTQLPDTQLPDAQLPDTQLPDTQSRDEMLAETVESVRRGTRWSRRTVLSVAACAAAVVLAMVPLGYWRWSDRLTIEFVVDSAQIWVKQVDPAGWRDDAIPEADFPLDSALALYQVTWQRMALPLAPSPLPNAEAVVYRGTLAPDHATALLFVVQTRQGRALPTIPPTRPDSSTGGLCIGVWKSQDNLYVLVVPGSQRDYLRALRQAYV